MVLLDFDNSVPKYGKAFWLALAGCSWNKWIGPCLEMETVMITEWLAKRLFPRLESYRQQREIRMLMVALWVGFLVAGAVTGLLILMNSTRQ